MYFVWHYGAGVVDGVRIISNLFWCAAHYFSLELLARSFFVPWRRLEETQSGFLARAVVSVVTRVWGIAARLAVFALAFVSFVLLALLSILALALWLLAPLIVLAFFIIGIQTLV